MRLRSSAVRTFAVLVLVALCAWLCVVTPRVAHAQENGAPTEAQVTAAVEKVKADPNLSQERKTRTLRWRNADEPRERSDFGRWIRSFFVWLGQLSRVLVWVIGGLLVIALAIALYRMVKHIDTRELRRVEVVPTHVRDLDIRPESLPDDIGGAAFELWQRGEHRAALALLYRGLLSRLAHSYQVPIRDSTTEGDCIALAAKHLEAQRKDYVTQLVRLWQRATYGGRDAQTDEVQALCNEFANALAPATTTGPRT